jgi:DNA primase
VCGCRDANFNVAKLVWNCWHCIASGKIIADGSYEIKEVETRPVLDIPKIRDLYTNLADKFHNTLTNAVREYLKSRGLTDETIEKFKLGFCSTGFYDEYASSVAEDAGIIYQNFPILANRVVIPYFVNSEVTDLRGRIIEPLFNYKKNTPTYLSLFGTYESRGATFLFNHDIIDQCNRVILTEGEFKALVAIQHGFPVVATPGIMRWTEEWTNLLRNKQVVLAADNEKVSKRRTPAYIQAKTLSKYLPNLKVAILFRDKTENKVDVDSFIINRGVRSFERLIEAAIDVDVYLRLEERKGYGK